MAIDKYAELTDQLHVGGVEQTLELARILAISEQDTVLDVACGLGGTARIFASVFRCRVVGIDRNAARIADATRLTDATGLNSLVEFHNLDIRDHPPFEPGSFTAMIGQSSWAHFFPELQALRHWKRCLVGGARIGIEECYLRKAPSRSSEAARALGELAEIWNVGLISARLWRKRLTGVGFTQLVTRDLSEEFLAYYVKQDALVTSRKKSVSSDEALAYRHAASLAVKGVIGFQRIISVAG